MMGLRRVSAVLAVAAVSLLAIFMPGAASAQQTDAAQVIRGIDAAVRTRVERVAEFTDTEHYAVFRGKNGSHPMAEMTVKTTYRKNAGKSYTVVSQSGPEIVQKMAFGALLDSEKRINQPGSVEASWFTSANYEMKLKDGGTEQLDGRDCFVLTITPKHKAPNMIAGTLWVDAKDYGIVQVQGMASKSPSVWAGPTEMMRQYANVSGFAMATHARAVSNSFLFGKTTVTIDYRDYQIRVLPAK
ncbi:MAG: hypothetical protein ABSE87_03095 [Terracidiphilus sp.]|jgi:hypothetical protein